MLAGKLRREWIVDPRAAALEVAVDRDRYADARAAYCNAAIGLAEGDVGPELRPIFRIIDRVGAIGSKVGDLVAQLTKPADELVLEQIAGVVGGESDAHVR